tara:strand:+ start:695 stop:2821 length:2127 start_codon:yes stop_codon:yes gene_type:complete
MSTAQKLIAATSGTGEDAIEPVGIDFNGSNTFLSRSSDLTNNASGKEFTISFWIYLAEADSFQAYSNDGLKLAVYGSRDQLIVIGRNSSGTNVLVFEISSNAFRLNTFFNVIISVDLTNTSNRYVFVNDENATINWQVYNNDTIDFTNANHAIGANTANTYYRAHSRMAGFYLDYTFRNLTTTSNRRLFIDADGLYVTPPTSGIISVPMDDASNPGRNDGTGGDFTLNGTIAQAGRGPNQYNGAASIFDGVAAGDKLTRTSQLTGISDTKTGTLRFSINSVPDEGTIMSISTDSAVGAFVYLNQATSGNLTFTANNSSGTTILSAVLAGYSIKDKWETHCLTFDLSDTSKRAWLVDGVATSPSWNTYTNDTIDYTRAQSSVANQYATGDGAGPFAGQLSDIWFDNSYTSDLSVFYDTDTGKPKLLGADGSTPTGASPKVYLPLIGNDSGNNKGTGGDFTVNSGSFTAPRGPSEFWGESAAFNGSNQYLNRPSVLTGASDGKILTFAIAFMVNSIYTNHSVFRLSGGGDGSGIFIGGGDVNIYGQASDTSNVLWMRKERGNIGASGIVANQWMTMLFSADLTSASRRHWYVDNISVPSPTISAYSNTNIDYTNAKNGIGAKGTGGEYFNGKIGFLYFSTEYIDFSSEANRLKFFDAFGFPVDLGEDGSKPTENQPLIYLNKGFHSGTNLGSGGDFTPVNTPTDNGYVKG